MVVEKTKKLWFPGILLAFEIFVLTLFGLLVEYDDGGQPGHEEEVASEIANRTGSNGAADLILELDSTKTTTKVYPCKLIYYKTKKIVHILYCCFVLCTFIMHLFLFPPFYSSFPRCSRYGICWFWFPDDFPSSLCVQ